MYGLPFRVGIAPARHCPPRARPRVSRDTRVLLLLLLPFWLSFFSCTLSLPPPSTLAWLRYAPGYGAGAYVYRLSIWDVACRRQRRQHEDDWKRRETKRELTDTSSRLGKAGRYDAWPDPARPGGSAPSFIIIHQSIVHSSTYTLLTLINNLLCFCFFFFSSSSSPAPRDRPLQYQTRLV